MLVISIPPRFGKSFTATNFVQWVFGRNRDEKVITGSYNERLSTVFAQNVRDAISEEKADDSVIVYSDIFPDTKIKYGDASKSLWSLEGSKTKSYLATSPTGTATGFGASLVIIDDSIKNALEAQNADALEKIFDWFRNTIFSRTERNAKIIIIMTRWATKDLAGRVLDEFKDFMKIREVKMKAVNDDGSMLCEDILSKEEWEIKKRTISTDILEANYNQSPIDLQGRLYERFLTYDSIPEDLDIIKNYTDTADTGSDYLCSICYGVKRKERKVYILDVLFTKDAMEVTEPLTAELLYRNKVNVADIESNNGGNAFSRNVKRILYEKHPAATTTFKPFHQSKNKNARIYSQSSFVVNNIYFPKDWNTRFPEFYKSMYEYQREGKNKHDDAQDAITGVCEKAFGRGGMSVMKY